MGIKFTNSWGQVTDNTAQLAEIAQDIDDLVLTAAYTIMDYSIVTGIYFNLDGVLYPDFTGWYSIKVPCIPGDKLRCTVTISGGANSMAVFYKYDNTLLNAINAGEDGVDTPYADYEFVVPANAYYVAISGKIDYAIKLEKEILVNNMGASYWRDKKIVWFGTSIPTTYPQIVEQLLGADITNESYGSSMVRNGVATEITEGDDYGWTGLAWQNVAYSLSATLAEKQELITNWVGKWQALLTNDPPATLDAATQAAILDCSYENRLIARHLGIDNRKDLYVFDHGHNDNIGTDIATMPESTRNKGYYLGAMNFLIDLILADNPRARICFIGHYENKLKPNIATAQEALAAYWNFPLLKLWEKLGWTQQTVTTTGYWDDGVWVASGGASQTITMTQLWMADNLHPHSDLSNTANTLIAENLASWLETVR
jgi:hypothetical protein